MDIKKRTNARIMKNLIGFNLSFFLISSALNGVVVVQSVLHTDQNLGSTSLMVSFIMQFFFCLVFPQLITSLIGFKWTMVISGVGAALYIGTNAYPAYSTLIPGILVKKIYFYNLYYLTY
jgi:hypothetical protein